MVAQSAETKSPPLLIDAREVARLLSVGLATVWRMRSAGQLPAPVRVGTRSLRWNRQSVLEFAQAGANGPAAEPDATLYRARRDPRQSENVPGVVEYRD